MIFNRRAITVFQSLVVNIEAPIFLSYHIHVVLSFPIVSKNSTTISQLTFTFSKPTKEILEKGLKYVQS